MFKQLKEKFESIKKELDAYMNGEVAPVQLASMTTKDGTVMEAESFEPSKVVTVGGVAVAAGEYTLEDGTTLVIAEGGVISEIKPMMEEETSEDFTAKFAEFEAKIDSKFAEYETKLSKANKVIEALMSITKEILETPISEAVEAAPAASFKAVEKETAQEKFNKLGKILSTKNN